MSRTDFKPGDRRFGTCGAFSGPFCGTCRRCGKNHSTHLIAARHDAAEAAELDGAA